MPKNAKKRTLFRLGHEQALLEDPVNRNLLTELRADARRSYADLGKSVHLSAPAVYERVRRLEASGVIVGHTVTLNPEAMGLSLCAFVRLATAGNATCEEITDALSEHPEIEECHSITGDDNLLLKVRTANTSALEELLQKIRRIPAVTRILTTIVLRTRFERGTQVPPART